MVEGIKHDSDKLRWDLLPIDEIEDIVKILTFGARKYGEYNWQQVTPPTRYQAAMMRHYAAWVKGEKLDPETGVSHLIHCAVNVIFLAHLDKKETQEQGDLKYASYLDSLAR